MAAYARGKACERDFIIDFFLTETLRGFQSICAHEVYNSYLYGIVKTKNEVQPFILKWSHVGVKKASELRIRCFQC